MIFFLNAPLFLFVLAFAVLLVLVETGFRLGRAEGLDSHDALRQQVRDARDGTILLLSLLLGFTLAMALPRYDERKHLLVDEANDIGTSKLRAGLLPEPYSTRIARLLVDYTNARLAYFEAGDHAKQMQAALERTKQLQQDLWEQARAASQAAPTAITATFIESLNETIDVSESQIASLENRIPQSVWIMIGIIAALAGLASGMAMRQRMLFSMVWMPLMAAVVMSLVADLDSPRGGLIRIGAASIRRLQASLRPTRAKPPYSKEAAPGICPFLPQHRHAQRKIGEHRRGA